jgi:hypothetical protein
VEISARIEQETEGYRLETEKYLKKWSEVRVLIMTPIPQLNVFQTHRTLLTWAAFNALKLKTKPDNASSKGLQLVLHRNSSANPSKAFVIITAKVVEMDDILKVAGKGISQKISAAVLEDRAREAANHDSVFPLIFLICEGLAQVMAVGTNDSVIVPEEFGDDEEWEMTLNRFGVE